MNINCWVWGHEIKPLMCQCVYTNTFCIRIIALYPIGYRYIHFSLLDRKVYCCILIAGLTAYYAFLSDSFLGSIIMWGLWPIVKNNVKFPDYQLTTRTYSKIILIFEFV